MADLEELADLAAETVAPAEVPAARRRRHGYSAAGLVALLTAGAAAPEAAEAAGASSTQAVAPAPGARRLPPRRRWLGTGLAVLGAGALCAGVLLHLPTPDPAPITGGAGYTTPSPDPGWVRRLASHIQSHPRLSGSQPTGRRRNRPGGLFGRAHVVRV